jgi:hypothetical protein
MSHTSPPTAADVTSLLENLPTPIILPSGFDVASPVAASIIEWNRRTRYLPFFQDDIATRVYTFDPPGPDTRNSWVGGSRTLLLDNGALSISAVFVGAQPAVSNAGTLLLAGQDYWLEPANAIEYQPFREPYTQIRFAWVQRGLPQSILITGIWGYCKDTIPDDAWLGMLYLAASFVLESVLQGIFASPTTVKDGDTSITQDSFRDLGAAYAAQANVTIARYRLQR